MKIKLFANEADFATGVGYKVVEISREKLREEREKYENCEFGTSCGFKKVDIIARCYVNMNNS